MYCIQSGIEVLLDKKTGEETKQLKIIQAKLQDLRWRPRQPTGQRGAEGGMQVPKGAQHSGREG